MATREEEVLKTLAAELDEAERQAWNALARYKFQMFGYWAAIWVHLNRVGRFKRPNPFKQLVRLAREVSPVEPASAEASAPLLAGIEERARGEGRQGVV